MQYQQTNNNTTKKLKKEIALLKRQRDQLAENRYVLSLYSIYGISLLSFYAIVIGIMNYFDIHYHQTIYTTVFSLIFFSVILFIMILHMKQPLSLFGFNLRNWRVYTLEATVYSLLFCIFITIIKWLLTTYVLALQHFPVFDFGDLVHGADIELPVLIAFAIIYILFVPLQVFIVHSALQSPMIHFIKLSHVRLLSVLVATLFFMCLHVSINLTMAITMFVPGIFWASLYAKHESVTGLIVSHIIVGIYGLYILGYGPFLLAL